MILPNNNPRCFRIGGSFFLTFVALLGFAAAVIAVLIGKNEKRLADEEARKAAKKNMVR